MSDSIGAPEGSAFGVLVDVNCDTPGVRKDFVDTLGRMADLALEGTSSLRAMRLASQTMQQVETKSAQVTDFVKDVKPEDFNA